MNTIRKYLRGMGHSLSARLFLIFLFASVAYGYAGRFTYAMFQDTDYLRRVVGAHIALYSDYILKDMGSPPDIERAKAIVSEIPVDIRIVGPNMDWSSSPDFYDLDEVPFGPPTWLGLSEASRSHVEAWVKKLDHVEFASYREHNLIKLVDNGYEIIFASPRISETPDPNYITWIIGLIGIVVLFCCYLAVRWVFLPIRWMQEGAARIGKGELDYRIPTPRRDELGDLANDINSMADDVEEMLEAKRQLMLAISHELRSPLTRSRVALELIDDEAARATILEDIVEMERLISDLLESEALNTRHAVIRREPVNIGELVESVLEIDFNNRNGDVSLQIDDDLPQVELDVTRIRLLMRNLIDNALRYNPEGGERLKIHVGKQGDAALFIVHDHGPGISAKDLKHVTEAFYRADPARSRATGGVGLGLYLCQRIVEAHGGTMEIDSSPESGTRVTVVLPG